MLHLNADCSNQFPIEKRTKLAFRKASVHNHHMINFKVWNAANDSYKFFICDDRGQKWIIFSKLVTGVVTFPKKHVDTVSTWPRNQKKYYVLFWFHMVCNQYEWYNCGTNHSGSWDFMTLRIELFPIGNSANVKVETINLRFTTYHTPVKYGTDLCALNAVPLTIWKSIARFWGACLGT